jgi:ankyrin repeat protein
MTRNAPLAAAFALILAASVPAIAAAQESTLSEAVRGGDRLAVDAALAQKADPNLRLPDTAPLLSWAVAHQNPDIVRALLKAGADPNAYDLDGFTPLILACQFTDTGIVGALLDAKADVRPVQADGVSALEICAKTAPPAILERLIAAGAPVENVDVNGQTPLMWAAAGGSSDNIAVLLKHGAKVNAASRKGYTPLFFAIKSGSPKAPLAVLDAGGDLNHAAADGTTAIQLAIFQKDFSFASTLANRGAALNRWDENGNQPLHAAALDNQVDFIRVLLAKGADANAVTRPPTVNWQTEPNAGRNPQPKFVGMTPLLIAAQNGRVEVMQILVDKGAKTGFRADDGANVVLVASVSGSLKALDYAVQIAPDLNVHNEAGMTPLHLVMAPRRGRGKPSPEVADMVRLLAAKGAPLMAKNERGQTPQDIARRVPPEVATAYTDALKAAGIKVTLVAIATPDGN